MRKISGLEFIDAMIFVLAGMLIIISKMFEKEEMAVYGLIFVCVAFLMYILNDLRKRIALGAFFACFFTYNLAGAIFPYFRNKELHTTLSKEEFLVSCMAMAIASLALILGTMFAEKFSVKTYKHGKSIIMSISSNKNYSLSRLQKVSFCVFIISTMISIAGGVNKLIYSLANGYVSLYTSYYSSALVNRMTIISMTSLMIGLALKPTKKIMWIYIIMGVINPMMVVLQGGRSAIVCYFIFVFLYLYSYKDMQREHGEKVGKNNNLRFLILVIISLIIFVPILYTWGYERVGLDNAKNLSIMDKFLNFFENQGESYKIIGYAYRYDGEFPGVCYSFGDLIDNLVGNSYPLFTVEAATCMNKFSNMISYTISPYGYFNGYGMGSSFIAELLYDFGYIGVFVGTFIIGAILGRFTKWNQNTYIGQALMFIFMYYLFSLPRASYCNPLAQILSASCIITFVFIFGLSKKSKDKIKDVNKNG